MKVNLNTGLITENLFINGELWLTEYYGKAIEMAKELNQKNRNKNFFWKEKRLGTN